MWLRQPDLVGRLRAAFHKAGIIGEENNTLLAYLAGVSRKLERPLASSSSAPAPPGRRRSWTRCWLLPGGGADQILGDDRAEPVLPGRDQS